MEKSIEIQKKSRPVAVIAAIVFLFVIAALAIALVTGLIFPRLEGFGNLKIAALVVIAFLPVWGVYLMIQQSSKTRPGLTISEHGITDYSNLTSVGFIPWSDIIAIKEEQNEFRQKLIVIVVKNPDEYIDKPIGARASRKAQHMQFGSPIVISASVLDFDTPQLVSMLKERVGAGH